MSYIRRKRVGRRYYLYELESYKDRNGVTQKRILQYLGAETPIYGKALRDPGIRGDGRGRSPEERREAKEEERNEGRFARFLAGKGELKP